MNIFKNVNPKGVSADSGIGGGRKLVVTARHLRTWRNFAFERKHNWAIAEFVNWAKSKWFYQAWELLFCRDPWPGEKSCICLLTSQDLKVEPVYGFSQEYLYFINLPPTCWLQAGKGRMGWWRSWVTLNNDEAIGGNYCEIWGLRDSTLSSVPSHVLAVSPFCHFYFLRKGGGGSQRAPPISIYGWSIPHWRLQSIRASPSLPLVNWEDPPRACSKHSCLHSIILQDNCLYETLHLEAFGIESIGSTLSCHSLKSTNDNVEQDHEVLNSIEKENYRREKPK